jgi:ankyrin repeat protein/uncharacterized small protein (DUF1192 family)
MKGFLTKTSDGVLLCSGQASIEGIGEFEQCLEGHRYSEQEVLDFLRSAATGIVKYSESLKKKAIGDMVSQEMLSILEGEGSEWEKAQHTCALVLKIYSREEKEGSPGPLYKEINRRLRTITVVERRDWNSPANAIDSACGELAEFGHLIWYALRTGFRLSPPPGTGPLTVFRGAELPQGTLEAYRRCQGRFIAWPGFTSFTTDRRVAERFAKVKGGGVSVLFELKTAGRPRIKSLSAHESEEELLVHPFSALRVDSVEGGIVKLTEVMVAQLELLPPMQTNYQWTTVVPQGRAESGEPAKLRAEVTSLRTRLAAKETIVGELQVKTALFEAEIARLKQEANTRDGENAELKQAVLLRDSRIAEVKAGLCVSQRVVQALREGQTVLGSRLPAQFPGIVPRQGEVTELHKAAEHGDGPAILKFADRAEFINAQDSAGKTPMWWAACHGKTEAVRALAALGANVSTPSNNGSTPVSVASQNGHESTARTLVSLGADVNTPKHDGTTPVFLASQNGHSSTVLTLASLGANVNTPRDSGGTPVYIAAEHGHESVVRALVSLGANVNAPRSDGWCPLMIAGWNGHVAVVAELLRAGACAKAALPDGKTALGIARSKGHAEIVALLEKA